MKNAQIFRLAVTVAAAVAVQALSYAPAATVNTLTDVLRDWMNGTLSRKGHHLAASEFRSVWSAFSATFAVGAMIGTLALTPMTNRLSRKTTIIAAGVISACGSILSACAKPSDSLVVLFIGRLVTAFAVPVVGGAGSMFLTELPEVKYRGACGCATSLSLSLGGLFVHLKGQPFVLGTAERWPFIFAVSALGVVIGVVTLLLFSHGSPHYLYVIAGDAKRAAKAVTFYQGASRLNAALAELEAEVIDLRRNKENKARIIDIFRRPLAKTTLLMFIIVTGCSFSGIAATSMFSTEIVQTAGATYRNAKLVALAISTAQVSGSFTTTFIVDRLGRRKVYITGVAGCVICNSAVVICSGLMNLGGIRSPALTWTTAGLLIAMNAAYALQEVVVLFIADEMYDQRNRNAAVGFVTMLFWFQTFVQGVSYPYLLQFLGLMYSLTPFVVIPAFSFCYAFFLLPETANRSILDIVHEQDEAVENVSSV